MSRGNTAVFGLIIAMFIVYIIVYFLLGYGTIGANKTEAECEMINSERMKIAQDYIKKIDFDSAVVNNISSLEEIAHLIYKNHKTIKNYQNKLKSNKGYLVDRKQNLSFFPDQLRREAKLLLIKCKIKSFLIYPEDEFIRVIISDREKRLYYSTVYHQVNVYKVKRKDTKKYKFNKYFNYGKNTCYEISIGFDYIDGCQE